MDNLRNSLTATDNYIALERKLLNSNNKCSKVNVVIKRK